MSKNPTMQLKLNKKGWAIIGIVAGVLVAFIMIMSSLTVIEQTEIGVYTVFGEYKAQLEPGIRWKAPFVSKVYKYDTRVQVHQDTFEAYTWDTQTVTYILNVQYRLDRKNVYQVYSQYGLMSDLDKKIEPVIFSESKNVFKQYSASKREFIDDIEGNPIETEYNEVVQHRDEIESLIGENLTSKLSDFYVEVVRVRLMDISFSNEYESAVEEKQVAYQNYLAEKNRAMALIEKTKGEANALLEKAKIEKEAAVEKANGEAQALEIEAQARAQVLTILKDAWDEIKGAGVEKEVLQQMFIEAWNGVLPEVWLSEDVLYSIFNGEVPQAPATP